MTSQPPPPPPSSPTPPPPPAGAPPSSNYLDVSSPYEVANWRPLVHWILFIPHAIILYALNILSGAVVFLNWFFVLFTGKLHPGLYDIAAMCERYNARAALFLIGFSETYPPFDFNTGPRDNVAYPPVRVNLPDVPGSVPRRHLANFILAIPHYFGLAVFAFGAYVVLIIGWFAVLFTGRWPAGMRDFLVRLGNYYYRVWTYIVMVDNRYPEFGLPR